MSTSMMRDDSQANKKPNNEVPKNHQIYKGKTAEERKENISPKRRIPDSNQQHSKRRKTERVDKATVV